MSNPVIQTKQTRRKFDKAFKCRAVELWLSSGKAATEVAAELGIHAQRLSAWRKHSAEQLEIENTGLRREVDYLRQQRDILKKTLGILSEPLNSAFNGSTR
jgi:transposase-like protein